jgi:hypothetical protein
MTKVKTWYADFTASWSVKQCGVKPSVDLLDCALLLAGMSRKRAGFEAFGAAMAMRSEGVTMQQYLHATGAAGACINTVGDNERNPFVRHRVVQAKQTRNEAGAVVYTLSLTAMAVKVLQASNPKVCFDGVSLVTPIAKPAAKPAPVKPAAAKPAVEPTL